jgi:hypothetical protein
MTESSLPSLSAQSTMLPLGSLQEILHNRIIQKKGEIHESHNRAYNDKLWVEIETLQWVWLKYDAAATMTSCIKGVCFFEPYQIFFDIKEIVIGLMA